MRKTIKRFIAGISAVFIGTGIAVPVALGSSNNSDAVTVDGTVLTGAGNTYGYSDVFVDVTPSSLHAGAMSWMYDTGVSTGWETENGREYRPFIPVSREAMAVFLYRFSGSPEAEETGCFNDISGLTFEKEICWMKSAGLTEGYPDGGYHPADSVNRDAMAAFLHRLSGDDSFEYNGSPDQLFADVTPNTQHAEHMAWMKNAGISTGWPDGTYRPLLPVNRDAMAAFLYRLAVKFPDAFMPEGVEPTREDPAEPTVEPTREDPTEPTVEPTREDPTEPTVEPTPSTPEDDATTYPVVTPENDEDKVPVGDPENLTDPEKEAVIDKVKELNPEAIRIGVEDNGDVTIVYPDGSQNTIPGSDIVRPVKDGGKKDAEKYPTVLPPLDARVPVKDLEYLSEEERQMVKQQMAELNPHAETVDVDDTGNVILTYPDGSQNTVPSNKTVRSIS